MYLVVIQLLQLKSSQVLHVVLLGRYYYVCVNYLIAWMLLQNVRVSIGGFD